MHDIRAIGARVRQARIDKDLGFQEVADKMGWSYWDYRSLENGWLLMSFNDMTKLASILGTTEEALLEPIPDEEYKKMILGLNREEISSVELLDAILDRLENIMMVEIARVEERLESSFITQQKELTHKTCGVLDISDEEGELPF